MELKIHTIGQRNSLSVSSAVALFRILHVVSRLSRYHSSPYTAFTKFVTFGSLLIRDASSIGKESFLFVLVRRECIMDSHSSGGKIPDNFVGNWVNFVT